MAVGRSSDCEVQLLSEQVSRHHARLRRAGPVWILTDSGSRNGSFHNGRPVSEVPLSLGDVIRLGDWLGIVQEGWSVQKGRSLHEGSVLGAPWDELGKIPIAGKIMGETLAQARRAAVSRLPLFLIGETGTGKEVVARAIHAWSGRSGAFVPVNCAALPESLAEAALFGHRKGAYTGAEKDEPGFFREAEGGTLLLDEIGDLSLNVQAKLLRVLEDGTLNPLGSSRQLAVDVRVIAAGQADIHERVQTGRMRADLFSRLQGLELNLPTLAERPEEIVPLFLHHLAKERSGALPKLQPEFLERLLLHDWPLNVREVVQLARQMAVLHGEERTLTDRHLPPRFGQALCTSRPPAWQASERAECQSGAPPPLREVRSSSAPPVLGRLQQAEQRRREELQALVEALKEHRGNVSKAASALGLTRRQAYRLLDLRPELDLASFRYSA